MDSKLQKGLYYIAAIVTAIITKHLSHLRRPVTCGLPADHFGDGALFMVGLQDHDTKEISSLYVCLSFLQDAVSGQSPLRQVR